MVRESLRTVKRVWLQLAPSVPRQSFLSAHCLKSNVAELRSHKFSWQIQPRNWR